MQRDACYIGSVCELWSNLFPMYACSGNSALIVLYAISRRLIVEHSRAIKALKYILNAVLLSVIRLLTIMVTGQWLSVGLILYIRHARFISRRAILRITAASSSASASAADCRCHVSDVSRFLNTLIGKKNRQKVGMQKYYDQKKLKRLHDIWNWPLTGDALYIKTRN